MDRVSRSHRRTCHRVGDGKFVCSLRMRALSVRVCACVCVCVRVYVCVECQALHSPNGNSASLSTVQTSDNCAFSLRLLHKFAMNKKRKRQISWKARDGDCEMACFGKVAKGKKQSDAGHLSWQRQMQKFAHQISCGTKFGLTVASRK